MLPSFAEQQVREYVTKYSLQASHDAFHQVVAQPHAYFTIADYPITQTEITVDMFEAGFLRHANFGREAAYEGMYVYLSETPKGVMFAEDIWAMHCAGIPLIYTGEDDTPSDPSHTPLQLCEEPNPRTILHLPNNIESVGWVLMVLGTCEGSFGSDYIMQTFYKGISPWRVWPSSALTQKGTHL